MTIHVEPPAAFIIIIVIIIIINRLFHDNSHSRINIHGLTASKPVCHNAPLLHVWEIGLLLLQDSDCGTVSKQNCDNLTSLSDNSVGRQRRICFADGCGAL